MDEKTYRRMIWSCRCGKTFRSYGAEARHRHNFPMLCKAAKPKKRGQKGEAGHQRPGL